MWNSICPRVWLSIQSPHVKQGHSFKVKHWVCVTQLLLLWLPPVGFSAPCKRPSVKVALTHVQAPPRKPPNPTKIFVQTWSNPSDTGRVLSSMGMVFTIYHHLTPLTNTNTCVYITYWNRPLNSSSNSPYLCCAFRLNAWKNESWGKKKVKSCIDSNSLRWQKVLNILHP